MELVYLWVESYKNIEKQGFNLSPKFKCKFFDEYNDNKQLKKECKLEIKDNKNYTNIFENINVMAIVGKNGSGKSSLQKIIFFLIFYKKYQGKKDDTKQQYINSFIKYIKKTNIFLIIHTNKEPSGFKRISLNEIAFSNQDNIKNLDNINFYSAHFNYMIDTWFDNDSDNWVKEIYHRVDEYKTPLLLEPYKGHKEDNSYIDISNIEYLNNQKMYNLAKAENKYEEKIEYPSDKFKPNKVSMRMNKSKIIEKFKLILPYIKIDRDVFFKKIGYEYIEEPLSDDGEPHHYSDNTTIARFMDMVDEKLESITTKTDFFIESKILENNFIYINNFYLFMKIVSLHDYDIFSKKEIFNPLVINFTDKFHNSLNKYLEQCIKEIVHNNTTEKHFLRKTGLSKKIEEIFKKIFEESLEDMEDKIKKLNIQNIFKEKGTPKTIKIENCIKFYKTMQGKYENIDKFKQFIKVDKEVNITDIKKIGVEQLPAWLHLEFYDNDTSYSSLSSGEKAFFNFKINVEYQITNVLSFGRYQTINLFFDEVELGLHPDWQKKFVDETLIVLRKFQDVKFNLFFASHSPFILSDFPKENVIFLENGKQVDVDIQTFGANIHTLLSHGFFMKDGLMGEFAKNKINNVIKLLNKKILNDKDLKYCEQTISIIGEPIVKNQLQRMLNNKKINYLTKDVKEEIEFLKHRIDVLRKRV